EPGDLGDPLLRLVLGAQATAEQDAANAVDGPAHRGVRLEGVLGRHHVALAPPEFAAAHDLHARVAGEAALRALDTFEAGIGPSRVTRRTRIAWPPVRRSPSRTVSRTRPPRGSSYSSGASPAPVPNSSRNGTSLTARRPGGRRASRAASPPASGAASLECRK